MQNNIEEIIKSAKRIKGKFPPISERGVNISKPLLIKRIYNLNKISKNLFLFIIKNNQKEPKLRYFIAILLASQSSDLLMILARDLSKEIGSKLIQYVLFPKLHRLSLIALKELIALNDYDVIINELLNLRAKFLKKMRKISNL
ncbi:MAG: hypothetical protein ACTSVV_12065 [Promethearchaeota archaeon]